MSHKNSFKKKLEIKLIPIIFRLFFIFVGNTCKQKWIGKEHLDKLKDEDQNWIYSLWHSNVSLSSWVLKGQDLVAMVSASKDGEMISRVLSVMGNSTIRGSSSKGGIKALFQMIKTLKSGRIGAITPDGPRGPLYSMQSGTITIAQKSSIPLVPIHIEVTKQWVFDKSWDKHRLPKPFSTILIHVGEPFWIPEKLSAAGFLEIQEEFKKKMMENSDKTYQLIEQLRNNNEI